MKANVFIRPLLLIAFFCGNAAMGQSISGVVNSYYQVTAVNTISNSLSLNTTSGLSIGTKVLLIQMKGAVIDESNSSTFGNISSINNAGNYEFNYICSISGNNVMLQNQILRSYDPLYQVQLVSVPVYSSVTISGTLTSTTWDPVSGTGGIVALEATNTIFLNADIDVSGQGFQGGLLMNFLEPAPYNCQWFIPITDFYLSVPTSDAYHTGGKKGESITNYILGKEYGRGKLASGGGGGNSTNTGGAGGGNYGKGGDGGQRTNESMFKCHGNNPGVGGLSLSTYGYTTAQNKIFFGGGGGAGHENNSVGMPGANGGGIIILTAAVITGSGSSILANGAAPINPTNSIPSAAEGDGGGGGGAGGTIILNASLISGSIPVQVNGGRGSDASNNSPDCMGPGGGGGAGVIWTAGSSLPAAIIPSLAGGGSGVVSATASIVACRGSSNFATAGDNGATQINYVAPMSTTPACTILASPALIYFNGNLIDHGALLVWEMNDVSDIVSYEIERSIDRLHYVPIASINNNGSKNLSYTDQYEIQGTVYYRLKLIYKNSNTNFSQIVILNKENDLQIGAISLEPNPAIDYISLVMFLKKPEQVGLIIYNTCGQRISSANYSLNTGYTKLDIPTSSLASGTYFLFIKQKNMQVAKRFIKKL